MTDADVAELAGYLEAMRAAARKDDGHAVAEADARFHGRIVELADNAHAREGLAVARAVLADLHHPGRPRARTRNGRPTSTRPILAALERRDTEAVVDALERHFERSAENMARRWPDDHPSRQLDQTEAEAKRS